MIRVGDVVRTKNPCAEGFIYSGVVERSIQAIGYAHFRVEGRLMAFPYHKLVVARTLPSLLAEFAGEVHRMNDEGLITQTERGREIPESLWNLLWTMQASVRYPTGVGKKKAMSVGLSDENDPADKWKGGE